MSTGAVIVLIVVIVVVIAVVAFLLRNQMRSKRLRQKFGPEYDRTLQDNENRGATERELADREKRHDKLDIKKLSPQSRDRYAKSWALIQEQFVDRPTEAVAEADRLVTELMSERGYPTDGYEQQAADLSVEHAHTLDHYRNAHDVHVRERGEASTEDLRGAMVHYRELFQDLLDTGADGGRADHFQRS